MAFGLKKLTDSEVEAKLAVENMKLKAHLSILKFALLRLGAFIIAIGIIYYIFIKLMGG